MRIPLSHMLRSVSIAESVASLLVLGLLESGTFSIIVVILPKFPSASIR